MLVRVVASQVLHQQQELRHSVSKGPSAQKSKAEARTDWECVNKLYTHVACTLINVDAAATIVDGERRRLLPTSCCCSPTSAVYSVDATLFAEHDAGLTASSLQLVAVACEVGLLQFQSSAHRRFSLLPCSRKAPCYAIPRCLLP